MTVSLRWLGCAGFRITAGDTSLLIDPWVSRNPFARPPVVVRDHAELMPAEAILLSHGHFDHAADVPAIVRDHPVPVYGSAVAIDTLAKNGVDRRLLHGVPSEWRHQIGPFAIRTHRIAHVHYGLGLVIQTALRLGWRAPGYLPLLTGWPCGQPLAFRLKVGDLTVLHMGTAGATPYELELIAEAGPVDVLLVAMQGNLGIHEIAAQIVERLKPRVVIPHHQDDFYPPVSMSVPVGPFEAEVVKRAPLTTVHPLGVGDTYVVSALRARVA